MFRTIRNLFNRFFGPKPKQQQPVGKPVILVGGSAGGRMEGRAVMEALAMSGQSRDVIVLDDHKPIFPKHPDPAYRKTRVGPYTRRRSPRANPHSAPFLLAHTVAPCRVYHRCSDRNEALKWLGGKPGVLEEINGFGQVTTRERI